MDLHLAGKRVLITGASKGIGAAAAAVFAEEGCHLHLAARNEQAMQRLKQELQGRHGVEVTVHAVDLRKAEDLARLGDAAADIDILVNNAGDIPGGPIDKVVEETWRHAWELKVFGYINLTRMVYAQMKSRGGGGRLNDIGAAVQMVLTTRLTVFAPARMKMVVVAVLLPMLPLLATMIPLKTVMPRLASVMLGGL
mgnify:CR=1 FL=1